MEWARRLRRRSPPITSVRRYASPTSQLRLLRESDGFCTTEEYASGNAYEGAEPPGGGLTVLHRGSSEGPAVALLQQRLSALGYPVALDGDFGPAAELAVRHFQAAAGLNAECVAGAQTWAALHEPVYGGVGA